MSGTFYLAVAISALTFLISTGLIIKGAYGEHKYILMGILGLFVAGVFFVTSIMGESLAVLVRI